MPASTGTTLTDFVDFYKATREKLIGSPDKLVSQSLNYRTHLIPLIMRGQKEVVSGGTEIVDFIQLSYTDKFKFRGFNDTFQYSDSDSLRKLVVPWRMSTVDTVVHEAELDLQQGGEEVVFKRVKKAKAAEAEASFWEGMENALWGAPDFNAMEAATLPGGTTPKPYSINCFVTKDGLNPTAANSGAVGAVTTWTSVEKIDASAERNWRNQVETFDNTGSTSRASEAGGLLPALDRMWLKTQFKSPGSFQQYQENTTLAQMRIVANAPSVNLLTSIARSKNNVLTPSADVGYTAGKVTYNGIPIDYIAKLDNIDTDVANAPGEDATASDGSGTKGFRFRFLNLKHFSLLMHSKHNRRMKTLGETPGQPYSQVMLEDTWWNLICRNRREQGIVVAA